MSLSARRAWIEKLRDSTGRSVELSLSARRAWIENSTLHNILELFPESLSARRAWIEKLTLLTYQISPPSRSPQGERG